MNTSIRSRLRCVRVLVRVVRGIITFPIATTMKLESDTEIREEEK